LPIEHLATVDIDAVVGRTLHLVLALKGKIAEAGVFIRSPAKRPVEASIRGKDRQIVDASEAFLHEPIGSELPIFVPA
jgi:hypothetical protein